VTTTWSKMGKSIMRKIVLVLVPLVCGVLNHTAVWIFCIINDCLFHNGEAEVDLLIK
jgi:hypothetical protein